MGLFQFQNREVMGIFAAKASGLLINPHNIIYNIICALASKQDFRIKPLIRYLLHSYLK